MMRYAFRISITLLLFTAFTATPAEAISWSKIFSRKKAEEKRFAAATGSAQYNPLLRWMRMSPSQRQKLREKYRIFKNMSPETRRELQRRYLFFESLAPEQRDVMKKKYIFFKNLAPIKRAQILRLHTLWQKTPSTQQQNIILQVQRIRNLPVLERNRELSRSVIWQVFSPWERKSLGRFMNNLQIRVFPFLPNPTRGKNRISEQQRKQDAP